MHDEHYADADRDPEHAKKLETERIARGLPKSLVPPDQ